MVRSSRPRTMAFTALARHGTGRPAVVVRAVRPDDVVTAVRFAGEHGMPIAVQAAGHGARLPADGHSSSTRPRSERSRSIPPPASPGSEPAPACSTCCWPPSGTVWPSRPGTRAPWVLSATRSGGGHGWFARQHGLASESVRSIDLVTPTGEELHLTAETDPDLWWGMLGHGAALATVTSLEVELHEVRELAGGRLAWPIHRTGEVLAAYADAAADLPGEVSL